MDSADDDLGGVFAGDLLLSLARTGGFVLAAAEADRLIASLEETLEVMRSRERGLRAWNRPDWDEISAGFPGIEQFVVDAVFAEQAAPGRLELALRELPKYIEALRIARKD